MLLSGRQGGGKTTSRRLLGREDEGNEIIEGERGENATVTGAGKLITDYGMLAPAIEICKIDKSKY